MKSSSHRAKPARRTAAMVIGDGLLLSLSLTGVFLFQFNVYGLPGSRNVVLAACLTAALLALSVFSLPKYRWAAVLAMTGLGLVLLWRYWGSVFQGAQAVYHTVAHVITESTDFPGEFPIPGTWTEEEIWAASNHFLTAVIFALALPLGWAVVRRRAFLPVLLLTLPWLIPIFLAEFPPDVISLSMLTACWMAMLLTGLTARTDRAGGGRLTLVVLPAALLVLYCICLIFPAESYIYPEWAATAAQRLTAVGKNIQTGVGGGGAAAIDLSHAGPRRYTGRSVLRVESDWTGRVYLRGAAYANYTGGSWEQLSGEALAELDGLALDHSVIFPSEGGQEQQIYSAAITHLNGSARMAYYPYQQVNVFENLSGASYVSDSYLRLEEPLKEYTVEFSALEGDYPMISDGAYRQFVYEHYLDVPEELTGILWDWQQQAEPMVRYWGTGRIAAAQAIADMLELTTEYDLQVPITPEGEDFVAYFLTESHRGYCVHYASAAVLLLRMNGIPARYVSGYTAEVADGKALVPDSAAHAWVEIYLVGRGWYPVEVTPAAAFDDDAAGEGATEASEPTVEPTPSAEPSELPVQPEAPLQSEEPAEEPSRESAAAPDTGNLEGTLDLNWMFCAAALVILGLPVLYRALRRRRWNRLTTLPDHNQAVLEVYGWYHKLTFWGGKPDQQIEDLARKAKFSQHVLTAEEHREAVVILRREIAHLSVRQPFWKRPFFWYWFIWK